MKTQDQVLHYLLNNTNEYVSGEKIANELFLSRNAVWKGVVALREKGHNIESTSGKGYRLVLSNDVLSKTGIEYYLKNKGAYHIQVFNEVTSTNTLSKQFNEEEIIHRRVVVAGAQSKGRGRSSKSFFSPESTGVYFSMTLSKQLIVTDLSVMTTLVAVGVARAIEAMCAREAQIKWVNDIYIDRKKVAGILSEASFSVENREIEYVVIGIGINVFPPKNGWPQEIKASATSVFEEQIQDARNKIIAEVLNQLELVFEDESRDCLMYEYHQRSLVIGKKIRILRNNKEEEVQVIDINARAELVVLDNEQKERVCNSGEIVLIDWGQSSED